MQFDVNRNKAHPEESSICPCCKSKVIAKCGSIKVWHWAHESLQNCDSWHEPMSEWHLWWQGRVKEELTEIIIGPHIADIKLTNGRVIEIQHSSISCEEAREREQFYGNMIWIFDGREFIDRFDIREKYDEDGNIIYHTFKFKHPRHYIVETTKYPLYIDFGDYVFRVKKFKSWQNHSQRFGEYTSWSGWGNKEQKNMFLLREIFGADLNAI